MLGRQGQLEDVGRLAVKVLSIHKKKICKVPAISTVLDWGF